MKKFIARVLELDGEQGDEVLGIQVNEAGVEGLRAILKEYDDSKVLHRGSLPVPRRIYTPVYTDEAGLRHFIVMEVVE